MPKKFSSDPVDELESSIKLLCDQANNHMKVRDYRRALTGYNKALELSSNDSNALIARSKCYLLLGDPLKALQDAETALQVDSHNIRGTYQKAESLYYLGQFEQSLIYFHRGLRNRPELTSFRLGIQKTQQAIENTIGLPVKSKQSNIKHKAKNNTIIATDSKENKHKKTISNSNQKNKNTKKLLGELCAEHEYLKNLYNHPGLLLTNINSNTDVVTHLAKDATEFLEKRQEFWRQQRPCTALPNLKNTNSDTILQWF